jgi:YfiH family protein
VHAVFTRIGGTSLPPFASLNVGQLVGDDPLRVQENHERVFSTLGIQKDAVVTARQVHGARVAVVGTDARGRIIPSTDALITQSPNTYLMMRFADCLPLMLCDSRRSAVALVHCGWRGVLAGVVEHAVQALQRSAGSRPATLIAAVGPSIGPCCYEVGPDVIRLVRQVFGRKDGLLPRQPNGRRHFDLPAAVRTKLLATGVQQIEESQICTACHVDEFYSHRAESGRTGRFAALIGRGRG